jgi:hypothetical protein
MNFLKTSNFKHFKSLLNEDNDAVTNFFYNKKKLTSKFLNIFFFLNSSVFQNNINKTAFFNFFYFTQKKSQLLLVDIKKIILRWELTFDFFFNMFFYKINPIIFSSPFFKKETLSFN